MILIGNSPSSGSTLLSDLLDSSKFTACGPELNLFSNKFLYNFNSFKKDINPLSSTSDFCRTGLRPNFKNLVYYGMQKNDFQQIVDMSENLKDFIKNFENYYLSLRGKNKDSVLFEKTPENINCLRDYISKVDSYFIFLVRNPLYVYNSIRKRGFDKYISGLIWLFSVAKYIKYCNLNKVLLIKYEDLVKSPFEETAKLINKVQDNFKITSREIEKKYKNNVYKKLSRKGSKSWNYTNFGKIGNANNKKIDKEILSDFKALQKIKINKKLAQILDIAPISYLEAIDFFNYENVLKNKLKNIEPNKKILRKDFKAFRFFYYKWKIDYENKYCNLKDILNYFKAITIK